MLAGEAVHDGLVERVTHVQRAGNVRRRELDREIFFAFDQGRRSVTAVFPFRAPMGLNAMFWGSKLFASVLSLMGWNLPKNA